MNALKTFTSSKSKSRNLGKFLSYIVLSLAAITMLLPLLWLINGSLQPSWQINSVPVIWIPREWNTVPASNTGRNLLLWLAIHSDNTKQEVIQIGSRRYTTVIDANKLKEILSAPKDQLTDAKPTLVDNLTLNVRDWTSSQGLRQVIAIAKDPQQTNNLLVIDITSVKGAFTQFPLDQVNKGTRDKLSVSGFDLEIRRVENGQSLIILGPESELSVLGSPDIAKEAELIQSERLGDKEYIDVGQTQLAIYPVQDKPADYRAAAIVQENWQPLMAQSLLREHAILANGDNLSLENEERLFNGYYMTVQTYTPPDGNPPIEVAILVPGSTEFLVIPVEYMDQLYAGPISDLVEPGSYNMGTLTYRVQEDYEKDGKIIPSALVGGIQDLALIVPSTVVKDAFDLSPTLLERSTHIRFNFDGYRKVINLKLGGTPFWKFFLNSGYVVLMNIIGHFFSCILVAYGFARLRSPGKNILFLILLGTMMVPGTIVTLPTYLIFRELGVLGTMIPLWLRSFFGNAFLIFVLRQFFMSIPYELDEAAVLDGANRYQVLTKVILPLSKPALATVGIFTFWWYWNAFLDPLIYILNNKYYTITLALNSFNQQYARSAGYYDRILAGSVLSLLPMVIIFIVAQRYFIEGIQMQGLKR